MKQILEGAGTAFAIALVGLIGAIILVALGKLLMWML